MSTLRSGYTWAVFFILSRLGMFYIWLTWTQYLAADVNYYAWYLERAQPGLAQTMIEYPVPVIWIMQIIHAVSAPFGFFGTFAVCMLLLDAWLAWRLWRAAPAAGAYWIVFSLAMGAIVWFRFDLVPAALVALALVYCMSHPKVSGALIAVGAAVKLWPALLIAPMAAHGITTPRSSGRGRLLGFTVTGVLLALASLATTGWTRTASPLTWQSDRGLQIESIPATPFMLLNALMGEPGPWSFALSRYNAWEVSGPWVDYALQVSSLLTVASLVLTAFVSWRVWTAPTLDDKRQTEVLALAVLIVILAMIVANKTFSTQYLLWIGGPIAVLLVNADTSRIRTHLWAIAFLSVIGALATQYIYPWGYGLILQQPFGDPFANLVMASRNIGIVALTIWSSVLLWRVTARSSSSIDQGRQGSLRAPIPEEGDRGIRQRQPDDQP